MRTSWHSSEAEVLPGRITRPRAHRKAEQRLRWLSSAIPLGSTRSAWEDRQSADSRAVACLFSDDRRVHRQLIFPLTGGRRFGAQCPLRCKCLERVDWPEVGESADLSPGSLIKRGNLNLQTWPGNAIRVRHLSNAAPASCPQPVVAFLTERIKFLMCQ